MTTSARNRGRIDPDRFLLLALSPAQGHASS
jgi:hypothetical protein